MSRLIPVLLWIAAVGCGCIGGVYFAFSTFVMKALERAGPASGVAAMSSINSTILGSLFMPLFWVTTLAALVLVVVSLGRWSEPAASQLIAGGVIYLVGMFGCTVVFNVPLNNELAAIDPATSAGVAVWARYLKDWTFWNHVRTVASLGAAALFICVLRVRGG